ncbi:MAG: chitinase [Lachnospiraceae bacterium]|nr:chitinase [Lachnospiraceae bacterium]
MGKKKKKKDRNHSFAKAIPPIIAILLILIIGGVYGFTVVREHFAYSHERMDLNEYYGLSSPDEVAVIIGDEIQDFKARYIDGYCYMDIDTVRSLFNQRFYVDEGEGLIIYVEPLTITTAHISEPGYSIDGNTQSTPYVPALYEGETLYLACDFVQLYTNYEYTFYEDPKHMQIYTDWSPRDTATVKKDTQVRYRGGNKSDILVDVSAGDTLYILDPMEEWTGVRTQDGVIGYVENKRLDNYDTETPIPVTTYDEPEFTSISLDEKINLTWHSVAGPAGNDTLAAFMANAHDVNVVSPTWFGLADNQGGLSDYGSASYVQTLHDQGIQVWGLVSNFVSTDIDTYTILSSTTTRRKLISNLMDVAAAYDLDGINVDFEGLNPECGVHFIQFIRELSVECRKAQVILSVDNYVPIGNTDFYNRAEQGVYADYVVIMGYDEHYAGSEEAGSVASIGYVTQGLENTISEVDPAKVINGIPFYTRIWDTAGTDVSSQAVDMATAAAYVADHNIAVEWDETTCQNYGEYTSGGVLHQVWLEDAESIKVKLSVMQAHNIAGVASWRIGMETPDIWDVIADYLHG